MKCVCVCLGSAERKKGRRREKGDEIIAWKYETMHGSPLNKNELAPQSQLFLSLWAWAENGEGKRRFLGFK